MVTFNGWHFSVNISVSLNSDITEQEKVPLRNYLAPWRKSRQEKTSTQDCQGAGQKYCSVREWPSHLMRIIRNTTPALGWEEMKYLAPEMPL